MTDAGENQHLAQADLDLRLQNAFLYELSDVTVEMLNETDINELFPRITERLLHLTEGYSAYIAIENESGEFADMKYFSGHHASYAPQKLTPYTGIGGTAWAENRIIYTSNYANYGNRLDFHTKATQACALPINCKLGKGGVLCILYDNPDIDVEAQITLLQKFEKIVAAALDNARSHQQKQTELSMLEAMMKINQAIYESTEYTDIVDSVCKMILEGFNANRARVYRYENGVFNGLSGRILTDKVVQPEVLPEQEILNESANMWTVKNLQAVHIKVGSNDERESARVHAYRLQNRIGCSYIVPLISNSVAWGVVTVHKPTGESDFSNLERQLIDLLASQISVTINRQRLMQEIEYQANHDQLTGCISRARFEKVLDERVEKASTEEKQFSLLFVDLDGFKNINDTLGHAAGDTVLVDVSAQIAELLTDDMCVARLGGDEFAILSPIDYSRQQTKELGSSIANHLSAADTATGNLTKVNASVGVARFPVDAHSARDLLTCADIAMYHAKGLGSGQVQEFDADFGARYTRKIKLQNRIEKALANDEFELHYQPRVRTSDGQVDGVEALIRWNEPEFKSVSPAEWIPWAEENGMIHRIGNWVAERSTHFLKEIKNNNLETKVSINISATQFDAPNFPQGMLGIFKKAGMPGSAIEFEITETAVITDIKLAVSKLEQIREYGITIAIDDFGVEYSSLAYLGDLPIDVVKIDRLFVQRMNSDTGRPMIEPILRLAQSLDLQTVVEGVETEEQKIAVVALGCDQIQGYYYSKPVPLNELPAVIEAINTQVDETPEQRAA